MNWNGEELHQHHQVLLAMHAAKPDAPVRVEIVRNGKSMTLEGTAPPRP